MSTSALLNSFKQKLAELNAKQSNEETETTLKELNKIWSGIKTESEVHNLLKGNKIFSALAKVMDAKYEEWHTTFPQWAVDLIISTFGYSRYLELFPISETHPLISVFRKYILKGSWNVMRSFRTLAGYVASQQILLEDDELYNTFKNELKREFVLNFLRSCARACYEPWQLKLMEDKKLINDVLSLDAALESEVWFFFLAIALHPDSKSILPKDLILEKASKSSDNSASSVFTLLCSESDLAKLHLNSSWIETNAQLLHSLITKGTAQVGVSLRNLVSVVIPMANLSVADAFKEELGKKTIESLLSVVADTLLDTPLVQENLLRARQEASRALWNLAYVESNRTLIKKVKGVERLTTTLSSTTDTILHRNISGILYMFTDHTQKPSAPVQTTEKAKGHVMISYNWANQPIVKRLAESLKAQGYNIWLDLEQMGGSTLEAMAKAVEESELILICMSQKYKDSPNCRLEGEYCVNRKIAFVPLMMQKGYAPDGWLGIALGAKLWYDFSSEDDWHSKITSLVKAIGDHGKGKHVPASPVVGPAVATPQAKQVTDWTDTDILKWMKAERIDEFFEIFKKHKFDGISLMELKCLHNPQNPAFFCDFICKQLGITDVGAVLRLSAAIRKL